MITKLKTIYLEQTQKLQWLPPLLARLVIGAVFIPTGWGKLHHLDQITAYFQSLGIPAASIQAPFVSAIELVGGGLVLLGFLTRFASLPLIGTMVVAILTAKLKEFTGSLDVFGTQEFDYIVLLVLLAVTGPGAFSIDRLVMDKEKADSDEPVRLREWAHAHV